MPRKCPDQSPAPHMAHTRRKFFRGGKGARGRVYISRGRDAGTERGRTARPGCAEAWPSLAKMLGSWPNRPGCADGVAGSGENAGIVAEPAGMCGRRGWVWRKCGERGRTGRDVWQRDGPAGMRGSVRDWPDGAERSKGKWLT